MEKGDVLIVKTPGGGGYGNSFNRDPKLVLFDVLEGKISRDFAYRNYALTLDSDPTKGNNRSS